MTTDTLRTPSQTVGPYLTIGLVGRIGPELVPDGPVRVVGRVLDGAGDGVPDGLVEVWQADAAGSYSPGLFGRSDTREAGRFAFTTVRPGEVEGQAPHLEVSVFARGLLKRVVTRMYFPDEPANEADPVLASVEAGRRGTLVAVPEADGSLRFDIHLQGDRETVFFEL
jgi:protocatechuate 3,4-dioxygenase, alpha subunit